MSPWDLLAKPSSILKELRLDLAPLRNSSKEVNIIIYYKSMYFLF